jgi:multiple sugar transport system permease protein
MAAPAAAIGAARRTRVGSIHKSRRWAMIWSYVFLSVFVVFFLMPPVYMFITSLKTSVEISAATNPWWVFNPTLENYGELLGSWQFIRFFINSAVVSG